MAAAPLAQAGQEVFESALVAPAVEAHVGPQLVQCFGTRCQLGVSDSPQEGGRVLAVDEQVDQQRQLFRRWTTGTDAHPHEALLGILALLHAASSSEVRLLRVDDLDPTNRTIRLGKRPHPVPMDPVSWSSLQRCLAHRADRGTDNPHVIVTRITKTGRAPASTAYVSHLLDPCGIPPRTLRSTRLADLVNTLDPKLVAAALGMDPEGVMIYLADHVDVGRLAQHSENAPGPGAA